MSRGLEYRDDVMTIGRLYDVEEVRALGGVVDYVVGTPLTKVYVLAEHDDPKQQHYLNLYKMGEGPLYSFFIPYHLVHFEVPNAIARVALFRDPVSRALAGPVVEVCAVAKRDLRARETPGRLRRVHDVRRGCRRRGDELRPVPAGGARPRAASSAATSPKDEVLTYDDVELPPGRLADRLRAEQYERFRGETWLTDVVAREKTSV